MNAGTTSAAGPWLWAGLFIAAMAGTAAASIFELIAKPWSVLLVVLALGLLVPMMRSARRRAEDTGSMSPALRTYNNRVLAAGGVYMVSFWIAASVYDSARPGEAVVSVLALVPAIPALAMIWAMARYIKDETDEYLRHQAIMAGLFGLALVLALATVWGFLETFGLVPHVWSWWVFPVWAIGMGASQCWMKVRGA